MQIFYCTSLKFHLKLATMGRILFDTLKTRSFQQLKDLSCTHFKLAIDRRTFFLTLSQTSKLKFSITRKTLFQTLSPWNLIVSKNWKIKFFHTWKIYNNLKKFLPHLPFTWKVLQSPYMPPLGDGQPLFLQPCKLKAFPQKDSPFLCYTS